ncbi:LOW QUALITY PROTEIN: hypothetical protein GQ55_2G400100 [Panicum hallii var. hallii]|uniref:F-box domain-containing protein n=1 Tax=Panicum hallii var. hallii TaxID=1504633 RepID=A0A2T7EXH3_9POAL|nr:LOW QUALITY PROTEIN: hypothetical protein GQ55_2G400100 [Panicum hallii var. hallii]
MGFRPHPPRGWRRAEGCRSPAAYLPDDLVVEILSRLPARSLCRFKCVSRSWRALISDRVDTALSFLPPSGGAIELLDSCCNGLLLLLCSREPGSPLPPFYVVCNPVTPEWVALPQPSHTPGTSQVLDVKRITGAAIGFDPTFSPHFYVFQLHHVAIQCQEHVEVVEIYSSGSSKWVLKESGWKRQWVCFCGRDSTFFNGSLHFAIPFDKVASVDTRGQSWRVTVVRPGEDDSYDHFFGQIVGHSQGRLLYMGADCWKNVFSIFVLEDYSRDEWTFRQSISMLDLFGPPS